jgi:hypothetical protein
VKPVFAVIQADESSRWRNVRIAIAYINIPHLHERSVAEATRLAFDPEDSVSYRA